MRAAVRRELDLCLGDRPGERVLSFCCLLEPFSVRGNGQLTQTLKLKRDVIAKEHAIAINSMYKRQ